jgi:hypothetical protein
MVSGNEICGISPTCGTSIPRLFRIGRHAQLTASKIARMRPVYVRITSCCDSMKPISKSRLRYSVRWRLVCDFSAR